MQAKARERDKRAKEGVRERAGDLEARERDRESSTRLSLGNTHRKGESARSRAREAARERETIHMYKILRKREISRKIQVGRRDSR